MPRDLSRSIQRRRNFGIENELIIADDSVTFHAGDENDYNGSIKISDRICDVL